MAETTGQGTGPPAGTKQDSGSNAPPKGSSLQIVQSECTVNVFLPNSENSPLHCGVGSTTQGDGRARKQKRLSQMDEEPWMRHIFPRLLDGLLSAAPMEKEGWAWLEGKRRLQKGQKKEMWENRVGLSPLHSRRGFLEEAQSKSPQPSSSIPLGLR